MTNHEPYYDFPGLEYCVADRSPSGTAYSYEVYGVEYGTTTSGQVVPVPHIEHWSRAVHNSGEMWDGPAGTLDERLLTPPQQDALRKAQVIKSMRQGDDAGLPTFSSLSKVNMAPNDLLYVSEPHDETTPYAAVRSLQTVGDIDFVTAVRGHYMVFRYHPADIASFVPEGMEDANAYRCIDTPRVIVDQNGNPDFQIAQVRLYAAEVDLTVSLTHIVTPPGI